MTSGRNLSAGFQWAVGIFYHTADLSSDCLSDDSRRRLLTVDFLQEVLFSHSGRSVNSNPECFLSIGPVVVGRKSLNDDLRAADLSGGDSLRARICRFNRSISWSIIMT